MLLDVGDKKYAVHFTHGSGSIFDISPEVLKFEDRYVTTCRLHEGTCVVKGCASQDHPLYGAAFCHPNDQFSKRVGRKMALARALAPLPRNLRQQIWDAYFKVSPHH